MNVQLYLYHPLPEWGGGHTFADEIFQSFLKVAHQSKHRFCVFDWASPQRELPPNLRWVRLSRSFNERLAARLRYEAQKLLHKARPSGKNSPPQTPLKAFMRQMINQNNVDLVMSWVPWSPEDGVPYVMPVWDLAHRVHPLFPEFEANGEWERREHHYRKSLPRAARITTGTSAGKEQIVECYGVPRERIVVLPLPTPAFALEAPINNSAKPSQWPGIVPNGYIFYPAQFWAHKNHVVLLYALKILEERYKIRLAAVFSGSDKGNLNHVLSLAARLGLKDRVHALGFVPRTELIWLYQHAAALTFVSYLGPDNLPPLEAFALGCPVVASRVEGAQEQLGDAALLVDPSNEEELAAAIKQVFTDNGLRQELIAKGHERAKRFSGRDYVLGLFNIFDELEPILRCWR